MTTSDRLTVEPSPTPMIEQEFTAPNISADDQIAFDNADSTEFGDVSAPTLLIVKHVYDGNLTQSELQSLRSLMKIELHGLNNQIAEMQKLQKFFYKLADVARKDVPHIATAFKCLNASRDSLREMKDVLRKYETIQRKLRVAVSANG